MKHSHVLIVIVTSFAILLTTAWAFGDTAEDAISTVYAARGHAVACLNADNMEIGHTPDFVQIDEKGKVYHGLTARTEYYSSIFEHSISALETTSISKIDVEANGVTLTATTHFEATMKPGSSGNGLRLVIDSVNRALWIHSASGWQEKWSRTISSSRSFGGKPI